MPYTARSPGIPKNAVIAKFKTLIPTGIARPKPARISFIRAMTARPKPPLPSIVQKILPCSKRMLPIKKQELMMMMIISNWLWLITSPGTF